MNTVVCSLDDLLTTIRSPLVNGVCKYVSLAGFCPLCKGKGEEGSVDV